MFCKKLIMNTFFGTILGTLKKLEMYKKEKQYMWCYYIPTIRKNALLWQWGSAMQRGIWWTSHSEMWPRSTDKFQLFSTLLGIRMLLFPAHRREAGTEDSIVVLQAPQGILLWAIHGNHCAHFCMIRKTWRVIQFTSTTHPTLAWGEWNYSLIMIEVT